MGGRRFCSCQLGALPLLNTTLAMAEDDHTQGRRPKQRWYLKLWGKYKYHDDVKYLEIDYVSRPPRAASLGQPYPRRNRDTR